MTVGSECITKFNEEGKSGKDFEKDLKNQQNDDFINHVWDIGNAIEYLRIGVNHQEMWKMKSTSDETYNRQKLAYIIADSFLTKRDKERAIKEGGEKLWHKKLNMSLSRVRDKIIKIMKIYLPSVARFKILLEDPDQIEAIEYFEDLIN